MSLVQGLNHAQDKNMYMVPVYMSPVSLVFHTEVTVSVGLKNMLRVGTSNIRCPCWSAERSKLSFQLPPTKAR